MNDPRNIDRLIERLDQERQERLQAAEARAAAMVLGWFACAFGLICLVVGTALPACWNLGAYTLAAVFAAQALRNFWKA